MNRPADRRGHIGDPNISRDRREQARRIGHIGSGKAKRPDTRVDSYRLLSTRGNSIIRDDRVRRITSPPRSSGRSHGPGEPRRPASKVIKRASDWKESKRGRERSTPPRGPPTPPPRPAILPAIDNDVIRSGSMFGHENYRDLLVKLVEDLNYELARSNPNSVMKSVKEHLENATRAECLHYFGTDRTPVCRSTITIQGLPPSVFRGSGFGAMPRDATICAAKDLVDKCVRIGFIAKRLCDIIEMDVASNRCSQIRRLPSYPQALKCLIDVDHIMKSERWPNDIMTSTELEVGTLDRLKDYFSKVKFNVYGTTAIGVDEYLPTGRPPFAEASTHGPPADDIERKIRQQREELLRRERMGSHVVTGAVEPLEETHPSPWATSGPMSAMQGSASLTFANPFAHGMPPMGQNYPGFIPTMMNPMIAQREAEDRRRREKEEEERLRLREMELKLKMEVELQMKRKQLEDDIRRQVQEEERARIAAEIKLSQAQSQPVRENYSAPRMQVESSSRGLLALESEEDEIGRLAKETEQKLMELQRTARESTLNSIFQSRVFQMVGSVGTNGGDIGSSHIKKDLLRELNDLLSDAIETTAAERRQRESMPERYGLEAPGIDKHSSRSRSPQVLVDRERDRGRERESGRDRARDRDHGRERDRGRDHSRNRDKSRDYNYKRRSRSRSSEQRHEMVDLKRHSEVPYEEILVQVGTMTLRNLLPEERKALTKDSVVIAQDMKTGRWQSGKVVRVKGNDVVLQVGIGTWKKDMSELYVEKLPSIPNPVVPAYSYPNPFAPLAMPRF